MILSNTKIFIIKILVSNHVTKPGDYKGRKKKTEYDTKKGSNYDWC